MDDVHGAHGTAGVVENPLLIVIDMFCGSGAGAQLVDDILDYGARVVAVGLQASQLEVPEVVDLEDVEGLEPLLQYIPNRRQGTHENGDELKPAADAA